MTTYDTIQSWTNEKAIDLIKNYDRLGLRASGKFAKDLETKVSKTNTSYRIQFLGSKHSEFMVNGRKRNQNQNKDSIRAFVGWAGSTFLKQWVSDKNLKVNPFAVAYKIARQGIKVPNQFNSGTLLSDVFSPQSIDDLLIRTRKTVLDDLRTVIKRELITI